MFTSRNVGISVAGLLVVQFHLGVTLLGAGLFSVFAFVSKYLKLSNAG